MPKSDSSQADPDRDAMILSDVLMAAFAANQAELHVFKPSYQHQVTERPVAAPYARIQARSGTLVINVAHITIDLKGAPGSTLLQLLDGSRDLPAICNEMARAIATMDLDQNSPWQNLSPEKLRKKVETELQNLARYALLIA